MLLAKVPFLSAAKSSTPAALFGRIAETLAIAAAGGLTLGLLGVPAGWLSGSILAVAGASLLGRPMQIPTLLMRAIFVLIGISLGAVVTPNALHGVTAYPLSILVLTVAMSAVAVAGSFYLRFVHGWDKTSSYLAASPGAMSQAIMLASELGADLRAVAIVQTMRVVIVAVGLPSGMALLGLVRASGRTSVGGPFVLSQVGELTVLIVVSSIAAMIVHRVRFPGGLLFGAMLMSGVLHGSGMIHAVMPWWAANAAQIALGAVTGARFANTPVRLLARFLAAALGSFAVAVAVAGVFAAGLAETQSAHLAEVMISFAPGSVDAMMLLALALNLDPVYVGAHHLARILFVSLGLPLFVRHGLRRQEVFVDEEKLPIEETRIEE